MPTRAECRKRSCCMSVSTHKSPGWLTCSTCAPNAQPRAPNAQLHAQVHTSCQRELQKFAMQSTTPLGHAQPHAWHLPDAARPKACTGVHRNRQGCTGTGRGMSERRGTQAHREARHRHAARLAHRAPYRAACAAPPRRQRAAASKDRSPYPVIRQSHQGAIQPRRTGPHTLSSGRATKVPFGHQGQVPTPCHQAEPPRCHSATKDRSPHPVIR